ncbi:MAG: Tol-Pal system beta propeller repeat protein TolB [Pseudomonadota bacterium]
MRPLSLLNSSTSTSTSTSASHLRREKRPLARFLAPAFAFALVSLLLAKPSSSSWATEPNRVVIDVQTKSRRGFYPIAVPTPVSSDPALASLVTEVQALDLSVSSWFKVLDPQSFLANLEQEGLGIEPQRWKDVGAFGVVKARVVSTGPNVSLQFKLFELEKGAVPVLERDYQILASDVRSFTHRWCNEIVRYYTGEDGFFGSKIVFVAKHRQASSIAVVDFDGAGLHTVTRNGSINILPSWSRANGLIAFTSYMRGNPDVYVVSPAGGRPQRVSMHPGMNTGAAWSPDGSRLAVTLSLDGNSEIYLVRANNGTIAARLTNNRYIDTSPAWSPDGSQLAFVSNREGGPQIFAMNADGSNQRRVSTIGGYNQTPAWCPRKGIRMLAYTAQDDASGHYDIVTLDLDSGAMTRITQNQGDNEDPTWAPGGRVLAFTSTRAAGAGIYLANADGTGEQRLVYRGRASSPDWGPGLP